MQRQVIQADGSLGVASPALALIHEIAHANYKDNKEQATLFEQKVARELGEPARKDYNAADVNTYIHVGNPTEHAIFGQWIQQNLDGTTSNLGPYTQGSTSAPYAGWGQSSGGGGGGGTIYTPGGTFEIFPSDDEPQPPNPDNSHAVPQYGRYHPAHPDHPSHPTIVGVPPVHG